MTLDGGIPFPSEFPTVTDRPLPGTDGAQEPVRVAGTDGAQEPVRVAADVGNALNESASVTTTPSTI